MELLRERLGGLGTPVILRESSKEPDIDAHRQSSEDRRLSNVSLSGERCGQRGDDGGSYLCPAMLDHGLTRRLQRPHKVPSLLDKLKTRAFISIDRRRAEGGNALDDLRNAGEVVRPQGDRHVNNRLLDEPVGLGAFRGPIDSRRGRSVGVVSVSLMAVDLCHCCCVVFEG